MSKYRKIYVTLKGLELAMFQTFFEILYYVQIYMVKYLGDRTEM